MRRMASATTEPGDILVGEAVTTGVRDGGDVGMVRGQDTSMEWDWDVLERRRHATGRVVRSALVAGGAAPAAAVVSFVIDRSHPAWLGFVGLVMFFVFVAIVTDLVGEHVYLLEPRRYLAWLRELGPYEPATIWEQLGHTTASWIGGTGLLVLGAVIGAFFGSQATAPNMTSNAMTLIGYLLMFAAPWWWAAFLVRLASLHHRAIKQGVLPVLRPLRRFGLFWLFTAFWAVSIATVLILVWVGRHFLQDVYGITFS
jgi:hypothetical protein